MRETPTYLQNHALVVEAYVYWPSFHDSPVRRFTASPEAVEMEVEGWEMTPAGDALGYFVLIKRHRVGFCFTGLSATNLASFLAENILFELGFSSTPSTPTAVDLKSDSTPPWAATFASDSPPPAGPSPSSLRWRLSRLAHRCKCVLGSF